MFVEENWWYLELAEFNQRFKPYFFNISFNIILTFAPRALEWSVPFRFSDQRFV